MKRTIAAIALVLLAGTTACAPLAPDAASGGMLAAGAPSSASDAGPSGFTLRPGDRFFEPGFLPGVTPRTGPIGGAGA
jgi:hypothetical protein